MNLIIQSDPQCERSMVRLPSRLEALVRFPSEPIRSAAQMPREARSRAVGPILVPIG